ncbi:hypothetical protein KKC22_20365 [Myxococcota bacterium]|nr:hypothetical protein [Myxococcota bacterium]
MKTSFTILLSFVFLFSFSACKGKKDKSDPPAKDDMSAPMQDDGMAAPKPDDPPRAELPKFEMYAPLVKLIEATKACKTPVFGDCAERKALDDWTSGVWMNKIEMTPEQKVAAFKTAAVLVLDKDEMIRNHAAAVFQIDPFGMNEKLAADPKLIEKAYIENLIKALPTLDSFRSGWLMSNIPAFAPAYGLVDECFKAADQCKEKEDLYSRLLQGFPKYSRLKHFDVSKKFAADTSEKAIPLATAALTGLQAFTWEKDDAVAVCTWLPSALPEKLDDTTATLFVNSSFLYRYCDLVDRCKVIDGKDNAAHLAVLTKIDEALKKLAAVKWNSEDYEKMYKAQVEHFTKTLADLKK